MKALIALFAIAIATPALAGGAFDTGDSYGPAGKNPETAGYPCYSCARPNISEATYAQLRAAGVTFVYDDRQVDYAETVNTDKSTLDEQIVENTAHARQTWERVRDSGGCNADFVPFYIASYCGKDAFGYPMGSEGGD